MNCVLGIWRFKNKHKQTYIGDRKCSPPNSVEFAHSLLDFTQKNPFFLVDWFSDKVLDPFEPKEKCRLKKGFPKELLMLELEAILGPFP